MRISRRRNPPSLNFDQEENREPRRRQCRSFLRSAPELTEFHHTENLHTKPSTAPGFGRNKDAAFPTLRRPESTRPVQADPRCCQAKWLEIRRYLPESSAQAGPASGPQCRSSHFGLRKHLRQPKPANVPRLFRLPLPPLELAALWPFPRQGPRCSPSCRN